MARTISIKLIADASGFQRGISSAASTVKSLSGEIDKANKAGKLDHVTQAATGLGLGLLGVAGTAVKMAADFDKSMSQVSAATHAPASQIAMLRAAAIKAGKDTQYSATEAANGVTELAKAGVGTADILGGGLTGALNLAAAGQISVADAAETAASAMTQFKLKGDQVPHVADLLAAAAGKAQGSVHDMGYALSQSGLVASQFGLSIEDTTGVLAEFASAGLLGSDAGTSFKQMLLAIGNPSKVTARAMQELGISFYDAQGKFIGLSGVATELHDKLGNLTEEERNAAMGQIFGSDAVRAATVLYKDGAKGVEEWKNKVNDAGYAQKTAADLTNNLSGDLERLRGSVETLAIQSGTGANGGLRVLAKAVNAVVNEALSLPSAVSGTLVVLAGATGVLALGAAGWIKYRGAVASAQEQLVAMGPAGERASTVLQGASKWAGRAAAAFATLEIAKTVARGMQDELNPQIDALTIGLERFATNGQTAGEASRVLGGNLDTLKGKFKFLADEDNNRRMAVKHMQDGFESLVPGLAGASDSLANTRLRVEAVDSALAQLASGGNTQEAAQVFAKLASQLAVGGVSMEEFRKQFPQYAAALEVADSSTTGMTSDVKRLGGVADSASGQFIALSKSIDELFQTQMSSDRAALKLAQSTGDLTTELLNGARTLSLNTAEGRKNRSAVLDQLDAIEAARDAEVRGGEALDVATGKYQGHIAALRKQMIQAGFSKKAIDELIGSYKSIPSQVDTKVSVTGAGAVAATLDRLSVYQQALKKGIIPAGFNGPIRGPDGKFYADGGWTGPGSKWQPAGIVHADEYVIQKDSRQRIEATYPGLLDTMNRTGSIPNEIGVPGYAGGGQVWPYPVNAAGTRIPSRSEVAAVVVPQVPGGGTGPGYKWMEQTAHAAFPGLAVYSDFRKNAHTLTGNLSYHAMGRAVDFAPSKPFAEWVNANYMAKTKELITPWQELNIHNGARHTYSALIENEHSGSNAHDHWAMANGGVIREPVYGIGASGDTYSFGEGGRPETVVPGVWTTGGGAAGTPAGTINYTINVKASATAHPADIGRQVVAAIKEFERGSGDGWRR